MSNKKLYLKGSDYNRNRIIEELAKIIENNDGKVKRPEKEDLVTIVPRGYHDQILEKETRLERIKSAANLFPDSDKNEKRNHIIEALKAEITDLKEKEASAPTYKSSFCGKYSWGLPSLHFVLDGYYYEFYFDDNPFIEDRYTKIKLNENNEYIGMYYTENLTDQEKGEFKEYLFDSIFSPVAHNDDITEMAYMIFNKLQLAKCSKRYYERKKTRVRNTYDGGYHYEYIPGRRDNEKHTVDF